MVFGVHKTADGVTMKSQRTIKAKWAETQAEIYKEATHRLDKRIQGKITPASEAGKDRRRAQNANADAQSKRDTSRNTEQREQHGSGGKKNKLPFKSHSYCFKLK